MTTKLDGCSCSAENAHSQQLLVFVADLRHPLAKHGLRCGRFVYQEAGHATQNIGLRLAADGLGGYVLEHGVLSLLGSTTTDATVCGAIACGRGASSNGSRGHR